MNVPYLYPKSHRSHGMWALAYQSNSATTRHNDKTWIRGEKKAHSVLPFYHFESRLITAATHTHAHNALLLARLAYYPKSERISCCCYCCWCVVCAKRPWLIIVDESNVHKSRIDRLLGHYFSLNRSISILWHKSTDFRRSIICHRLESKRLKWIDAPRRFSAADRVFSCIHLLKALVLLSLIICHYFDHMLDVWAWASAMQMAI